MGILTAIKFPKAYQTGESKPPVTRILVIVRHEVDKKGP